MPSLRALTLSIAVGVLVLALASESKPKLRGCQYWCKEDDGYFCCPSDHEHGNKNTGLFRWAMEELFGLHDDYPWLVANSWMHYLFPVIFQRSWQRDEEELDAVGSCPKPRSACPRSIDASPPAACDYDDECDRGSEKCCYDVCLDHKTCKTTVGEKPTAAVD